MQHEDEGGVIGDDHAASAPHSLVRPEFQGCRRYSVSRFDPFIWRRLDSMQTPYIDVKMR